MLAVYQFSSSTPLDRRSAARRSRPTRPRSPTELPDVRDVIVGNEPNLNLFWHAAVRRRAATTAAAIDYELLLAETYDALKAQSTRRST